MVVDAICIAAVAATAHIKRPVTIPVTLVLHTHLILMGHPWRPKPSPTTVACLF
jgi:hypothetical protein